MSTVRSRSCAPLLFALSGLVFGMSCAPRAAPVPGFRVSQRGVESRLWMATPEEGLGGAGSGASTAERGAQRTDGLAQTARSERLVQDVRAETPGVGGCLVVGVAADQQQRNAR